MKLDIKNKHFLWAFLGIGGLCLLLSFRPSPVTEEVEELPAPTSVDTFIPAGYVLVPIELTNAESLASLVGDVGGVVDLYATANDQQKPSVKVGSKLKLLRAPLNPQQYAVLVKDDESTKLLSYPGPFLAVVQNPDARGAELTTRTKKTVRIDYQN